MIHHNPVATRKSIYFNIFVGGLFEQVLCFLKPQVNLRNAWLQLSSCMLATAFVLGNSIKTVFEAVIFLFVVHPYDVGDGVKIGSQPDYYIVRHRLTLL